MNLNILYPDFLFFGEPYSLPTAATGYSFSNLITGSRQLRYKHGSSTTTLTIKTDARTINGAYRQAEYLYVAGMNLLCNRQNCDIEVKGADDSAISVNVTTETATGISKSSLFGKLQEDYILNLAGNYRDYWQVKFTVASAQVHQLRKVYIGKLFDFGVEPDAPLTINYNMEYKRQVIREIDMNFMGVNNEKVQFFMDRIYKHRQYNPVVLYSKDNNSILNEEKLFHCSIEDLEITPIRHDFNLVKIKFVELI
jgi:hypothetical protein